jgi:putative DNA primase/helicase
MARDNATYDAARNYLRAGFSLVPILTDGTKRPAVKWQYFQQERPDTGHLASWFSGSNPYGIALVHGAVSGNSEVLDFDSADAYTDFARRAIDLGIASLINRCVNIQTPSGGRHLYYRHQAESEGNQKLARAEEGECLIETRGEGGYTLAPGSPAACHPSHNLYKVVTGSSGISGIPTITADERNSLLELARSLDRYKPPVAPERVPVVNGGRAQGDRLGDDYNCRADILPVLLQHGWQEFGRRGDIIDLTRPGKSTRQGASATLNAVAPGVLYIFSSSAAPFEPGHAYTPFGVYGLLECGGDFSEAARRLAGQGYGNTLPRRVELTIEKYEPETEAEEAEEAEESEEEAPEADETAPAGPDKSKREEALTEKAAAMALTDLGNAERLILRHGRDLRHCPAMGWLTWNGSRWVSDESGEAIRRTKHAIRAMYEEAGVLMRKAASSPDEEKARKRAEAHWTHAKKSEAAGAISAALKLAETEPGVYVAYTDLDTSAWLLNCTNGTLDLQTGELRRHKRADLITRQCPIHYDPDANAPVWEAFLERILPDADLRAYVQRAVGYSLSGDISEQCMFFCHGQGSNGKSTLLRTVLNLSGDYGKQASSELLVAKRAEMIRDDVAALAGKRFVATIETDEGRAMAEALMKQLTGGDRITARFLYKNAFEFDPTFKVWLAANHKPVVKGSDHAVWRRIKLIPFTEKISNEEKDPHLLSKLTAELPGILAWAVRGCLDWQQSGMREPDVVKAFTEEYRSESDFMGLFLSERCEFGPSDYTVRPGTLYEAYKDWCGQRGERFRGQSVFSRYIKEQRGIESKTTNGYPHYVGVRLLPEEQAKTVPLVVEGEI